MISEKSRRDLLLGAFALGYAIYFVRLMLPGLQSWFSGDDLLNIYYAWSRPPTDLLRGNILFFSHYTRPLVELLLYAIYAVFGFHPGPFNVVRLLMCTLDVIVLYVFASKLARSREVGVLTVMLVGFHAQLYSLYYDSGMLFDALAFLFFYSGLALYFHYRRKGGIPDSVQTFKVVILYIAALNSKEIAVSFPVALFLYELTVGDLHPRALLRRCRTVFITGVLTLVYIIGKNTGADPLSAIPAYHPVISLRSYIHTYAHYAGEFVLLSGYPPDDVMAAVLAACIALGLLLRNRVLIWASLFNLFAILPIAFIPARDGFAFFVPLAGWGIYGAALLADLRQRLLRLTPVPRLAGQAAVAGALFFLVLLPEERIMKRYLYPVIHEEQFHNRDWWTSLRSLLPAQPGNMRILALHDPFRNGYHLLFLTQLGFDDHNIVVDTSRSLASAGTDPSYKDYALVIDYDHGQFRRVEEVF